VAPVETRPVLDLVAAARGLRVVLVGIGGHGGAGKTTLARAIPGAQVVSTDEFWQGDGFDIERLRTEVVEPVLEGRPARFASFDWVARAAGGERVVEPSGVIVVEGVCALHRSLREAYAVRIWVEAPYDLRVARGVARDGEGARSTWVERWIPSEERYVARDDPRPSAHLVVDGSGPPPAPASGDGGSA
jgi:uridine kinase